MQAYFITFRCYGTWLPGDERGAVNHRFNQVGTPRMEVSPALERHVRTCMNEAAIYLDAACRVCVEKTTQEVATYRGWVLHALNVRTNHVHVVISANCSPEKTMRDLKSWTTRRLREHSHVPVNAQVWAEHGSTIYLNDAVSFENACLYVLEGQGRELPQPTEPEA